MAKIVFLSPLSPFYDFDDVVFHPDFHVSKTQYDNFDWLMWSEGNRHRLPASWLIQSNKL